MISRLLAGFLIVALLVPPLAAEEVALVCRDSDAGMMPMDRCCCAAAEQTSSCDPIHMIRSCCCDVRITYRLDQHNREGMLTGQPVSGRQHGSSEDGSLVVPSGLSPEAILSSPPLLVSFIPSSRSSPSPQLSLLCIYRI
ncbi:MAG: hypothetical protein HY710_00180 [Candidatus Latescibacteria bacterium]|nr:hypothetical protein [Candidatus Latescibacterota bacterium]